MSLPPLPEISPSDQQRVFRHRGADVSNEQLSLLGDPILTTVITDWIIQNRPAWSPGEVSIVRAALVRASSVADWTTMYNLQDQIQSGSTTSSNMLVQRSQGAKVAVFKAYVAAVYQRGGFLAVHSWMSKLLSFTVDLTKFDHPPSLV
ncbi:ribonuclease III [Ceratobasidium sp. AG-Ba]|nr:ribonuclease III [Ceratobasidium sp. AG-Ba]